MLKDILLEKELFIFDMDGTITDTEPLHFLSYQRTLAELFPGFVLTEEEFLSCYVGHPETEIYALLQKAHGIVFADDVFFQKRIEHLFRLVREVHLVTAPFYRQICSLFPEKEKIMLTSQRLEVLARFRQEVDFGGCLSRYISVAGEHGGKPEMCIRDRARAIEAALDGINPLNAGKKKEEALSMLKKWFPQMEDFAGQLKKYKVTIADPVSYTHLDVYKRQV